MANTIINPKPAHLSGDSAKFHSKVGGKSHKGRKTHKTHKGRKSMKSKKSRKSMRKTMRKTMGKKSGGDIRKAILNKLGLRKKSGLTPQDKKKQWWEHEYNKYIQDEICKKKNKLQCEKSWFSEGQQINRFVKKKWPEFTAKYTDEQNKSTKKINPNLKQPDEYDQQKENKISAINNIFKGELSPQQHEYAGYLEDLCVDKEVYGNYCNK